MVLIYFLQELQIRLASILIYIYQTNKHLNTNQPIDNKQGDNMDRREWQNKTGSSKKQIGHTYGLTHNQTAVSSVKVHELSHCPQANSRQILMFLTLSTFDGEFVVLQNERQVGKLQNDHPSFAQKLRIKTHIPIANCCLEFQFMQIGRKEHLIGFFVDIFSNLYTFNLTTYFEYQIKIKGIPQPIKYTPLYYSTNFSILQQPSLIYRQHPMFLTKSGNTISTISLGGSLKMFDIQRYMDKSWISSLIEPQVHQFDWICLAVAHNKVKCALGNVTIMVFNNKQIPFVYVNCNGKAQYKKQTEFLQNYYEKWQDEPGQITFCQYDHINNFVVVSTRQQSLQLFQVKKISTESRFVYCCQRKLVFYPSKSQLQPNYTIEHISINRGMLAVATCEQYILINLQSREVAKRGKGSKQKNNIQKLRWIQILDKDNDLVSFCLIKGYSHHNQAQSKVGKPNIHFKTLDLLKKKNI